MKFIIRDWADNVCFGGKEFDSFEDAWDYIYVADPNPLDESSPEYDEHWFDDYYVEEKGE